MATPPSSGKVNISTPHMLLRHGAELSREKSSLPSYHLFFFLFAPHRRAERNNNPGSGQLIHFLFWTLHAITQF